MLKQNYKGFYQHNGHTAGVAQVCKPHFRARGLKKVLIRAVDTDVVVLVIAYARKLDLQELWIAFGVGNHFRYLSIHKTTTSLTQDFQATYIRDNERIKCII